MLSKEREKKTEHVPNNIRRKKAPVILSLGENTC